MAKKILSLLLVFSFMTVLAACESKDTTISDSSSSEVSLSTGKPVSENSSDTSSITSKETSSETSSVTSKKTSSETSSKPEDRIYYAEGFRFEIPEGFEKSVDGKSNDMFVNSNFYMLGYEVEPNEDGKTTITQEDFEKELAEEPENPEAKMDIKLISFRNTKVDGKEAAVAFCDVEYQGILIPTYYAVIINGDTLVSFTLVATEEDLEILTALLASVKFD